MAEPAPVVGQLELEPPPGSSERFGESVVVLVNGNYVVVDSGFDGDGTDLGAAYLYDGSTDTVISTLVGGKDGDRVGGLGVTGLPSGNFVVGSSAGGDGAATWVNGNTGLNAEMSVANSLLGTGFARPLVLPSGNFLLVNPSWGPGTSSDFGAVTWVNGNTGLSGEVTAANSLVGSSASDRIGGALTLVSVIGGVRVLPSGNYLVNSPFWNNGATVDAGAVTWGNGNTGVSGEISSLNSLVGSSAFDQVGLDNVTVLTGGNYVVSSPRWDGVANDVGAVTWGNGNTGVSGEVSAANSLVGSTAEDLVGSAIGIFNTTSSRVVALENGHYVVGSPERNGLASDTGAATWGNGNIGVTGTVTNANSLVGTSPSDELGEHITPLSDGDYVVAVPNWDAVATSDVGAAAWANGFGASSGELTAANSLLGASTDDFLGAEVFPLQGGRFSLGIPRWDEGATDVGLAVWGAGDGTSVGQLTAASGLAGSTGGDMVGEEVVAVGADHAVVVSPEWDSPTAVDVGAVTWVDGAAPPAGVVSAANSFIGGRSGDQVGSAELTVLPNGDFVVSSPGWDSASAVDVGAVTLLPGDAATVGVVSASNSLVGSSDGDRVGEDGSPFIPRIGVSALASGNFVVNTRGWDGPAAADVGAVTFVDAESGTSGEVSAANSLVGSSLDDGSDERVIVLENGNYLVGKPGWDSDGAANVGAITLGDGTTGTAGVIGPEISVTGSSGGDAVGAFLRPIIVDDDEALVVSAVWDADGQVDAGAVTLIGTDVATTGPISARNSVIGTPPGQIGTPVSNASGFRTSNGTIPVPTTQGRVLLLQSDVAPTFGGVPPDVVVSAEPGRTSAAVMFDVPVASDIHSDVVVSCDPMPGSEFPVGTTTVTCTALDEGGFTASVTFDVTVAASPLDITSIDPARLLETREGDDLSTIDGESEGDGRVESDTFIEVQIAGRGGVPIDAPAAVFNVTAINPAARGFVTVYPCGERPLASSLNFAAAGVVVGNEVIAKLSADGTVCAYTSAETDLTFDVVGFASEIYRSLDPARLLETRTGPGTATVDGDALGDGRILADTFVEIPIAGRGGLPMSGAAAVVMNVTAINPAGRGFVTISPCGPTRPLASSLNYSSAGAVVGNEVIAKLSPEGTVCAYTSAETDLTFDAVGYFSTVSSYTSIDPARVLETRDANGATTIDGVSEGDGRVQADSLRETRVAGRAGVPDDALAVVLNVTVINPTGRGFITLNDCGPLPLASSLNFAAAGVVAGNEVVAKLSADGTVCAFASAETDLTFDVTGFVSA